MNEMNMPAELKDRHHNQQSQYLKFKFEQTIKVMQPCSDFKWEEVTPYDIDMEIDPIFLFKGDDGRWYTIPGSGSDDDFARWAAQFQV